MYYTGVLWRSLPTLNTIMRYILIMMLIMMPLYGGSASSNEDFINLIENVSPAVVVIQAELEEEDGFLKNLKKRMPKVLKKITP